MFARFDENPAMTLRVIKETKRYGRTDGLTDNVKTVYPLQTKFAGGIKTLTSAYMLFSVWCDYVPIVWCDYVPINNFSVMSGRVFLGLISIKQKINCLAQGHNTVPTVRLKPPTSRSEIRHPTTDPSCS